MNKEQFDLLEQKASKFKHTSLKYLSYEDIQHYNCLMDTLEILLLTGENLTSKMKEVLYACNDLDTFSIHLASQHNAIVKFIPREWYLSLKEQGYQEYSIIRDYWLTDLHRFDYHYPEISVATIEDAHIISNITIENAGTSRAFYGDSVEYILSWIDGSNDSLINMNATCNRIYVYKQNNQILGIAATCIYAIDSPNGAVVWLREIAVKKEFHGRGIGRKLVLTALSEGVKNGAKRSFLMTDDLNTRAKQLYESIGFQAKMEEEQIDMITPAKK